MMKQKGVWLTLFLLNLLYFHLLYYSILEVCKVKGRSIFETIITKTTIIIKQELKKIGFIMRAELTLRKWGKNMVCKAIRIKDYSA